MTEKLDNGDTNVRKGYTRSIVDAVEVDDKAIRKIGNKDVLQAVTPANDHQRRRTWFCMQMARTMLASMRPSASDYFFMLTPANCGRTKTGRRT
jgi:hypothetical protein